MGWHNRSYGPSINSFKSAMDVIHTMRSPGTGRIIQSNTHLRLETPELVVVRHHKTDIVRFHADDTMEIRVADICTSNTTRDRIRSMTGASIVELDIPAVNGYRTSPNKSTFVNFGWNNRPAYAYCWKGQYDPWIRIKPDEKIDESTVMPHEVNCVTNPKALRKVMLHLGKVVRIALGYAKLAGTDDVFEEGTERVDHWLMYHYNKPLDETKITPLPRLSIGDRQYVFGHKSLSTAKNRFKQALDDVRFDIARREGWVGKHKVLKIG